MLPTPPTRRRSVRALVAALAPFAAATTLEAQTVWTGAGGDTLWSNPANWQGNVAPGSGTNASLEFRSGTSSNDFAGTFSLTALVHYNTSSSTTTVRGNPLSFGDARSPVGLIESRPFIDPEVTNPPPIGPGTLRLLTEVIVADGLLAYVSPGNTIDFGAKVTAPASGITFGSGGTFLLSAPNNAISKFDVDDNSQVFLSSGSNTFDPGLTAPHVTLLAGTLRPAFGSPRVGNLAFTSGAVVRAALGTSVTVSGNLTARENVATLSGPLTLTQGPHLLSQVNVSTGDGFPQPIVTLNSSIDGPGSLIVSSTPLLLTASPADPGTLTHTGVTSLFASRVSVAASGVLSPASNLFLDPSSTLTLTGTTQTVPALFSLGTLGLTGASLTLGSAGNYPGTTADQMSGPLFAGNATITKVGPGTLRIDPSSFSQNAGSSVGATAFNASAGTLVITPRAFPNALSTASVQSGATLRLEAGLDAGDTFFRASVSGAGTLSKADQGRITLTGNLTGFTGILRVEQGTLVLASSASPGSAIVSEGARLDILPTATLGSPTSVGGTLNNTGLITNLTTVLAGGLASGPGTYSAVSVETHGVFRADDLLDHTQIAGSFALYSAAIVELLLGQGPASAGRPFDVATLEVAGSLFLPFQPHQAPAVIRLIPGPGLDEFVARPMSLPLIVTSAPSFTPTRLLQLSLDTSFLATLTPEQRAGFALAPSPDNSTLLLTYTRQVIPEPAVVGLLLPAMSLLSRRRR